MDESIVRLGTRLALAFGALGVIVASMVGFAAIRATSAELDDSIDEFLLVRAGEVVDGDRRRPGDGRRMSPVRLDDASERPSADSDVVAQTLRADGQVVNLGTALPVTDNTVRLAGLRPERYDNKLVTEFDDVTIDDEPYRMISVALPDGGALQIARSTEENQSVLTALAQQFALIAAVAAALAALIGWLVARRVTRPIRRLSDVTADVAETRNFTVPIDVDGRDEVGQLARSVREMLDALEQSREQQQRLVHDAGHELRTPLTSLRANVGLLERAPNLPPEERAEVVAAIREELRELSDLFDEMIDLASDQYSTEIAHDPVVLADLARRVADRWERRTGRPIEVAADDSIVLGDVSMLDRAVSNLLSNSHKFSPPGRPIGVEVRSGALLVRDEGPGIPPAERQRVFDRFHRSEHTRSQPGSGLGLAIVAQIAARHGGTVSVGDAPSGGAEVGLRLPLAPFPVDDVGAASASESPVDAPLDRVAVEE